MSVDVVGLGYCVYDIVAIVAGIPDFDNVAMTPLTQLVHDGGGMVGTALTALARLGVQTSYVGVLGQDQEGGWLCDLFRQEGIDMARLRQADSVGTNVCLILVDQATARRAILCHRRVRPADLTLNEHDRAYIQAARVLHLDGQFMPAAIQAARWARKAGVKVCLDANHPRDGLPELLPLIDWLVVAESFPTAYTGISDLDTAARSLLSLGAEMLIVTQGESGCQAWTADESFYAPGIAVEAVDTTGAGDAFHGAFIYAMLQGWELRRVAGFANTVAALNCRTLGGRRGLPTPAQVQRLLDEGEEAR